MKIEGYVIREEKENYVFKNGGMLVVFSPVLVDELAKTDPVDMQAFELLILSPAGEREPDYTVMKRDAGNWKRVKEIFERGDGIAVLIGTMRDIVVREQAEADASS